MTGCLKEFVGTPPWMAPEVASLFWSAHPVAPRISATENEAAKSQHEHAADPPSGYSYEADIWSLGITAYEVATGKLPWPSRFKVREVGYFKKVMRSIQVDNRICLARCYNVFDLHVRM